MLFTKYFGMLCTQYERSYQEGYQRLQALSRSHVGPPEFDHCPHVTNVHSETVERSAI